MAENRRGKENRFYFSRGQMVLLGTGFTLASAIIFVLGIFVGKGIEARRMLKPEEPLVKIPVKPGAQQSSSVPAAPPRDEITFNDALPKSAASAAVAEEKPEVAKPAAKETGGNTEEKPAPPKPKAPATKVAEKKVDKPTPAAETAKKAETASNGESKEAGKGWRAQVNAFPDERSAKLIVDRLKNKGYNAYVTEVQNRGKTWYRVNVGKFGTRDEADKMVELLRTKENYPKAFAASR
ncbi:MAG: SPOR domain-containing protein [Chloroflexota bacterium]